MTAVGELELPVFDYTDSSLTGPRFHEAIGALAERSWIARVDPVGFMVLDHDAAAFLMRTSSATFPGRLVLEAQGVTAGPLYDWQTGGIMDLRGDAHRRLRRLVQPAFTPASADAQRPAMRRCLEELFGPVACEGACDFVAAVAKPYPALMIASVMGAPPGDAPRLASWANTIQGQFDPIKVANELASLERAVTEFQEYARELLRARRGDPRDDLISTLIELEEEGDRLSEDECVVLVGAVLVGGVDTTQAQLAHAIRLFAEHPDQWRMLADDPSVVPAAVEEVLRFEPITPLTVRIALEEIEYRGVTIPENTIVAAAAVTANRDPDHYDEPDRFDITADRGRGKPLTFGAGPHYCLGANLARAELQEALAFLAPRMPDLELAGDPVYDTPLGVYGLLELPIRFRPAA